MDATQWLGVAASLVGVLGGSVGLYLGVRGFRLGTLRRLHVQADLVRMPAGRGAGEAPFVRFSARNPGNQVVPLSGLILLAAGRELNVGDAVPGCFPHDLPGGKSLQVPVLAADVWQWLAGGGPADGRVAGCFVDGRGRRYRTRAVRLVQHGPLSPRGR